MNTALALIEPTDGGVLENLSKKSIREGEQKLMLAVLENATEDFQKYVLAKDKKGKRLFDEAEEWILATHSDSLFSFENICEILRLDPGYVRNGLRRWKEARGNGRSKKRIHPHRQSGG